MRCLVWLILLIAAIVFWPFFLKVALFVFAIFLFFNFAFGGRRHRW
jgi:hypothetical protein